MPRSHHHPQPLGGTADRAYRKAKRSAIRCGSRAGTRRNIRRRAPQQSAAGSAPSDGQPGRPGEKSFGARHQRAGRRIRPGLRHHHRRHYRAGTGAAHCGLGRYRPAHRARDQKSADADSIVGGTAAPQIRQGDRRGRCRVRAMHRDHRAPGRRHQANGRRVLALRAHAQGGHRRRGRGRYGAPGRFSDARRPSRHRFRRRSAGGGDACAVRPAADFAGADQHHQERDRGDRRRAASASSDAGVSPSARGATARTSSST